LVYTPLQASYGCTTGNTCACLVHPARL
jgi:hypothetical protein